MVTGEWKHLIRQTGDARTGILCTTLNRTMARNIIKCNTEAFQSAVNSATKRKNHQPTQQTRFGQLYYFI